MSLNQKEGDSVITVHPFQHGQFPERACPYVQEERVEWRSVYHIMKFIPVCILQGFLATYSGSPKERTLASVQVSSKLLFSFSYELHI